MFAVNLKDIPRNSKLLLAVSGGADSMALLASLCALRTSDSVSLPESFSVLHINHNLRGQESKDDADFVRAFCEEKSIPCTIVSIPEGEILSYAKAHRTGIEAAARDYRRKALIREAKRIDGIKSNRELNSNNGKTLILTAHTKDDVLELLLMRILRGSGPAGLSAMPVRKGRFVRPLLEATRAQVIAYLKENKVPWREDSSNTDEKFLRNKIRHKLVPFLTEITETQSWKKGIEGMAETQSLAAEFIEQETKKRIVWEEKTGDNGEYLITDENNFFSHPEIIREESLFKAINNLSALRTKGSASLKEKNPKRYVLRQFCEGNQKAADLGPVRIIRKNGKLILSAGLERTLKY